MAHTGFPVLGLAADAMRALDFSSKLFSDACEIYRSSEGKSAEHKSLEMTVESLNELCHKLVWEKPPGRGGEDGIVRAAQLTSNVAKELSSSLQKLQRPDARRHRLTSLGQSLGWMLNRDVGHLRPRLNELRNQLSTEIVAYSSLQQQDIMNSLDKIHGSLGPQFNERFEDFKSYLSRVSNLAPLCEGLKDLNEMVSVLTDLVAGADKLAKEQKLLSSLQFTHMDTRRVAIVEAHEATFRWILASEDYSPSDPRSILRLRKWLQEGEGIYWISGKPGSGKSTLMKYLGQSEETMKCLQVWARGSRVAMPAFYFWISGSEMQKSQQGLLQQLLYELFQAFPDTMPIICPEKWDARTQPVWTVPELLTAIKRIEAINSANLPSTKVCFFIDGLDEYLGDHRDLIDTVKTLARLSGVKVCASSRPWNCFKDAFGGVDDRRLYLEDFTREDVASYARSRLSEDYKEGIGHSVREALVGEIVDRAQGVFLWVYLVVRSLREGFDNGDSLTILQDRLKEFPSDLDEFFTRLVMSVDKVYRRRMSASFQVALKAPEPMLLIQYHFLEEEESTLLSDILSASMNTEGSSRDLIELEHEVQRVETRVCRQLNGRYKGLLEAHGFPSNRTVNFIHRTVRDFLMAKEMQELLHSHCARDFDPSLHACMALLAQAVIYPGCVNDNELNIFMNWARNLEVERRGLDPRLIDKMNQSFRLAFSRRPVRQSSVVGHAIQYGLVSYIDYITAKEPSLLSDIQPMALKLSLNPKMTAISHPEAVHMTMRKMLMLVLSRGPYRNLNWRDLEPVDTFFKGYSSRANQSGIHFETWIAALDVLLLHGMGMQQAFTGNACWFAERLKEMTKVDVPSPRSDERLLRVMELFLNRGLDPNSSTSADGRVKARTIWETTVVAVIDSQVRGSRLESLCVALVELFLKHGADPSFRIRLTEVEHWDGRLPQILYRKAPISLVLADVLRFFTDYGASLQETFWKAEAGYYRVPKRPGEGSHRRCDGREPKNAPNSKRRRLR